MKLIRPRVWTTLVLFSMLIGLMAFKPLMTTQAGQNVLTDDIAFMQVAHLAPFAEDATVTVTLNGEVAIPNFNYGDSTEYLELAAGEYTVGVVPAGATDPAIEATIDLAADTYYTAVAIGDGLNQDLDLILLVDDLTAPAAGKFHLRLGHLAPFAPGAATADVRLFDGTPVLENVNFAEVTGFIALDAGTYDLIITTPGGATTLIDLAPVTFAEGMIISAFVSGEGVNQDLGTFALPSGEEGFFLPLANAYLQVAHLAPFAEDASVTIALNGTDALTDFGYGDSTGYIPLPPGTYDIAVTPTGATDPAIEATVDLERLTYYTAVAVGDGDNQDLDLILLEDDLTAPAAGKFHLRLGHLAPFAPGAATADVRLFDGTPVLENVNFAEVTGFIALDAGTYDLIITTPGGATTLIDLAPVTFAEGMIISAFVSGEGVNQDLGTFALPSGEEGFFLPLANAYLQVAHLAPFAEDASVTIALNGTDALTDFGYGDSTGYIPLPPGTYDIAVTPTGATDPAIEATVDLERLTYYTAVAVGDGDNQDLDLILLEDDLTAPAAGQFHLRLGHLAPFATGADVLADVRLQDGTPILEGVDFGDVTAYLPLPAGRYNLVITTPGGGTALIDPLAVDFAEGTIISAFATGDGVNQDLAVFALPAGEIGFFLPDRSIAYFPLIMMDSVQEESE